MNTIPGGCPRCGQITLLADLCGSCAGVPEPDPEQVRRVRLARQDEAEREAARRRLARSVRLEWRIKDAAA